MHAASCGCTALPRFEGKSAPPSWLRVECACDSCSHRHGSSAVASGTLLALQLFAKRLRWPCDPDPAECNLQQHFLVRATATCSELRLPLRATQRRCNFARAAAAHGAYVTRLSSNSKSSVILQFTGWLHNRLQYACGGHAIVTRADATCSCTARSNPPRRQESQTRSAKVTQGYLRLPKAT